jgi:hypothetical protein
MRLTLRTLLAYLDGILEPSDRDEIKRKIEESEIARQLVERLRESMRNPRLSAPKVSPKNGGPDPNTVAEYLDNTLASERVTEFETLCLDSDIELAEVAACHQILTMVLGQPAEIDLEMKQHMYGINSQASERSTKPAAGHPAPDRPGNVPDDMWVKPKRRKVEIPDYLRERSARTKWKSVLAAVIVALILIGGVVLALGPLDRTHPLAKLLGFGQPANIQVAQEKPSENQIAASPSGGQSVAEKSTAEATSPAKDQQSAEATAGPSNATAAEKTGSVPQAGQEPDQSVNQPNSSNVAATDAANPSVAPANPMIDKTASATDAATTPPIDHSAPTVETPLPTIGDSTPAASMPDSSKPTKLVPPQSTPSTTQQMASDTAIPAPMPASDANATPADQTSINNTPMGRLVPSKSTVLLAFDASSGNEKWVRVPSGASVLANEPLLVLPTYRPTITLSAGLTLQVPPETEFELKEPDARGIPTVQLIYGRLVVMTVAKAGAQLRLEFGGINGVVTFDDAEATLGVEVRHSFPAGVNPEIETPKATVELYAVRGHLEWTPTGGAATGLSAMQMLSLGVGNTTAAPIPLPNMPKWIEPEQLRALDSQASEFLAQSLQDPKPLSVALREMVDHRKVELKSLGAQCLALLGEFDPLVAAFNDPDQRPMWPIEIVSVKAALARGPNSAAKVREAFAKQHGDDLGKDVYRMFLGYTKEQLQAGEATKLVDFLDHDSLDCRELAFANLEDITNKTFNYRPEVPAASRAVALHRWQQELSSGGIVPKDQTTQK